MKKTFLHVKQIINNSFRHNTFSLSTLFNTNPNPSSHPFSHAEHDVSGHQGQSQNFKRTLKRNGKNIAYVGIVFLVVLIVAFAFRKVSSVAQSGNASSVLGNQPNNPGAKKSMLLNKEFSFALKDNSGKEVDRIRMVLLDAQLQDAIYIKGRRATALKNRTFLVVDMKITNDYRSTIRLNTRDYFRLSKNNSPEKLAPDIHNDPAEVQATSTKYTRVGFPINNSDKNLMLRVGEINGEKQTIQLRFK